MRKILIGIIVISLFSTCTSDREVMYKQISENEQKLFGDSLKQLDAKLVAEQIDMYNQFAEKYPDDTLSPAYLFKAADLANGFGRGQDAVKMLETILVKYPGYNKAAAALFMEAFIFETTLHDNEKAIEKYKQFVEKYPDHNLAEAAQFSLVQLQQGLSPEEIVRMFEAKNESTLKPVQ